VARSDNELLASVYNDNSSTWGEWKNYSWSYLNEKFKNKTPFQLLLADQVSITPPIINPTYYNYIITSNGTPNTKLLNESYGLVYKNVSDTWYNCKLNNFEWGTGLHIVDKTLEITSWDTKTNSRNILEYTNINHTVIYNFPIVYNKNFKLNYTVKLILADNLTIITIYNGEFTYDQTDTSKELGWTTVAEYTQFQLYMDLYNRDTSLEINIPKIGIIKTSYPINPFPSAIYNGSFIVTIDSIEIL